MKTDRIILPTIAIGLLFITTNYLEAAIPQPDITPIDLNQGYENQTWHSAGQGWKKSTVRGIIRRERRIIEEYSNSSDGTPSARQLCSDFALERTTPEIIAANNNLDAEVQSQALQCIDRLKSVRRISVSTIDAMGFAPHQHGYRVSQTFVTNTNASDNVNLTAFVRKPGIWRRWSLGEHSLIRASTNAFGLFQHGKSFLNKGIFWSATATNDNYRSVWYRNRDFNLDYQVFGNFPIRKSMLAVARWLDQTEILYIQSVENNNYSEAWGRGRWCEDSRLDTDRPGRQGWSGLCDKLGDAIVHSGIALDHFIGTGAIIENTLAIGADLVDVAIGAVRADGVYAPHMLYVRGVVSTSHAAAKIGAIAARIAAEMTERTGRRPLPEQLKAEMFRQSRPETLKYQNGNWNDRSTYIDRTIMVIE